MTEQDRKLIAALSSCTCACGRKKSSGHSFCGGCYYSLSLQQRRDLYKGVGEGYAEAYASALASLAAHGRVPAKGEQ